MTALTILAHLAVCFCGFLLGTILACIVLVKKNGERYAQIKEEVRTARTEGYSVEDDPDADNDTDCD